MRVSIHQPQFLPWLGYLDKINQADYFVILDNVQFKKNEWQNRNRIRTCKGFQWLSVPILHSFGQQICDVQINNCDHWKRKHLGALKIHYEGTPFFSQYFSELQEIYSDEWQKLSDFNVAILLWLLGHFGIDTPMQLSSDMNLRQQPTERLIDICRTVGASTYLAGQGAHAYMDLRTFEKSGMTLEVQDYQPQVYPQRYDSFLPCLSAIDLLFNCGSDSAQYLNGSRAPKKEYDGEHVLTACSA
ncbi:MAG: hypothetical protein NPIRA05_00520 [Nitrospirales bacterium]|nr:MAG: hypothetical protein NPIRA05_00520 [Nitrospirales bacterium]